MVQWESKVNELEILYVWPVCVDGASLTFSVGLLETRRIFQAGNKDALYKRVLR